MAQRFDGKTILVTGGAGGMGEAHARAFAAEGGKVLIGDIVDEQGEALAAELGDAVHYLHLDVTDEDAWSAFVDHAEKEFGPVSVLVNNAGIGAGGPIEDITFEDWRKALAINLDGTFLGSRAVVPSMKKAGGGSIINVSSYAGQRGTSFSTPYTASKFGVVGLTKALATEVADFGIRVNSVHPGYIRTPILGETNDNVVMGKVPIRRMGRPEEVSRMVLFLASDEASYSTGSEFSVDGGWAAGSPVMIGESNADFEARIGGE
ncbi:glucose 1-dehydrogenase [Arthrobacter echini]|uniref:Glucose 1-dehydrogenase n=1 Tax=Arthrobacter echini TaxID=1529066 RepID=A0A4S5E0Y3_9MICC|nr:glucose 1-dehydrogenase [Arthrobacter echini]THJ64988.1 glucose 1-dehydrogenase [Arthrobacter echini]